MIVLMYVILAGFLQIF